MHGSESDLRGHEGARRVPRRRLGGRRARSAIDEVVAGRHDHVWAAAPRSHSAVLPRNQCRRRLNLSGARDPTHGSEYAVLEVGWRNW